MLVEGLERLDEECLHFVARFTADHIMQPLVRVLWIGSVIHMRLCFNSDGIDKCGHFDGMLEAVRCFLNNEFVVEVGVYEEGACHGARESLRKVNKLKLRNNTTFI